MPGLCGLLNHSAERSLRLVTPVSGLFMVSPAAHTRLFVRHSDFGGRCLHDATHFANPAVPDKLYDFDPTTPRKKSDKTAPTKADLGRRLRALRAREQAGTGKREEVYVVRPHSRRAEVVRQL